ncbi:sensor histidine kinase [Pontibacter sp. G13]|uniref:tetratricopeptide repeat-containing sensor histidine kinase n=1 Tax=Pontibacter sp. G13 TaxID=3074898 RepID=UPI00288B8712|nr:sensor histidine kinase [Pontibacter sp. G13]WNJ21350.1 sensor histidine kinase [Pontibacter sp. G13]
MSRLVITRFNYSIIAILAFIGILNTHILLGQPNRTEEAVLIYEQKDSNQLSQGQATHIPLDQLPRVQLQKAQAFNTNRLPDSAEYYFKSSIESARMAKDTSVLSQALNAFANFNEFHGNPSAASRYRNQLIKLLAFIDDPTLLQQGYVAAAESHFSSGQEAKGFELLNEALERAKKTQNAHFVAKIYNQIGRRYYDTGDTTLAQIAFNGALGQLEDDSSSGGAINAKIGLAAVWTESGKLEKSSALLKEVLNDLPEDDIFLRHDIYHNLAYNKFELEEYNLAMSYARKAHATLGEDPSTTDRFFFHDIMSGIFSQLNRLDSALVHRELAWNAYQEIYDQDQQALTAENQSKLDYITMKRRSAEAQSTKQQKIIERNIFLSISIALLASLITGVYYYFYRQKVNLEIEAQKDQIHKQQIDELVSEQNLSFITARLKGKNEEQKRIARQLHDQLGSMLVAAKWQFDNLKEKAQDNPKLVNRIHQTSEFIAEIYNEVRGLSYELNAGNVSRIGLPNAISDFVDRIAIPERLEVDYNHHGDFGGIPEDLEINTFLIIQEIVANALKHAEASKLEIQIQAKSQKRELSLMIIDNGKGFDPLNLEKPGMGLKSLEERVQMMQGSMDIDSGLGAGTTFVINLPIPETSLS